MAAPPVPPRPYDYNTNDDDDDFYYGARARHQPGLPPPVPPLPAGFQADVDYEDDEELLRYTSPRPHFGTPLAAPRPHKVKQDVTADMRRNLEQQVQQPYTLTSMPMAMPDANPAGRHRPSIDGSYDDYNPGGFAFSPPPPPGNRAGAPAETMRTPGPGLGPVNAQVPPMPMFDFPQAQLDPGALTASMSSLSFDSPSISKPPPNREPTASTLPTYGPERKPPSPPPRIQGPPSLTAPLPTTQSLTAGLRVVQSPSGDPVAKVEWCKDVMLLVRMAQQSATGTAASGTDLVPGPASIANPELAQLADIAVPLIDQIASTTTTSTNSSGLKPPLHVAEAIYLRAMIMSLGSFPQFIQPSPRMAFRDFEKSARAGYHPAWFRLGRDYETFNDEMHAKDCFERGVKHNVESCLYRMGMAYLMGQLGLPKSPELAIPLLHRAATLSTLDCPQPAYVFGLLLLSEFNQITLPPHLLAPLFPHPSSSSIPSEARKHLERAAYLHFSPAQYKLGHAYEFAIPPFPFDALLSVQYYSLASQQGEVEADMALSKWFLCGAEGCFEKDEGLAYTFAEKAARKGLPTAQFAMGYYLEVGVGGPKDIEAAKKWYNKAVSQGNEDARARLAALDQAAPQALSRQEHDKLTHNKLVRKRTQAQQRSEESGASRFNRPGVQASEVMDVVKANTGVGRGGAGAGGRPVLQQQAQYPPQQQQQQSTYPPQQQQQQPNQYSPPRQQARPPHSVTMPGSQYAPPPQSQPQQSYPQQQQQQGGGGGGPAHRHTYSLTDTGPVAPPSGVSPPSRRGGGGGRAQSPAGVPPRQRPQGQGQGQGQPPSNIPNFPGPGRGPYPSQGQGHNSPLATPHDLAGPGGGGGTAGTAGTVEEPVRKPADKYQTFAEMGIQGVKADDKECVVM